MQASVFSSKESDLDGLTLELNYVERFLTVAGRLVQVGESAERCQYRIGAIEHLHLQFVKSRNGSGFRRVDVQPECQRRRGCSGWDCDSLRGRVGVRRAIAVQPGIERAAVRRF